MRSSTSFHTRRTDFRDEGFKLLVAKLDAELEERDGAEHGFYDQFNSIQGLDRVVLVFDGESPVGCGAIKPFKADSFEIKRMYVLPAYRGSGAAHKVLSGLEEWAFESGAVRCVLETGKRQPEAIAFYRKAGYSEMENYGPYIGIENSVCFVKRFQGRIANS